MENKSHFKVKAKHRLEDMNIGDRIESSDFATLTNSGTFVQLEYVETEEKAEPYKVKPGLFNIQKTSGGLKLNPTSFVKDEILTSFVSTRSVTDKIDCFFNKLDVYKKHGIEVPLRSALLYGSAGTGKTTSILATSEKYLADGKTTIVIWPTDKIDPFEVKDFVQTFEYVGTEKLIFVIEDIGGVEIDQVKMKSTSSLLSLLDNKEKTFKIPTFNIATTNHPEVFLGSLTNRPGRFADKIEIGFPTADMRVELMKFFSKGNVEESILQRVRTNKFNEFTADHIREVIIRADLYDLTHSQSMDQVAKEIEKYKQMFVEKKKLGIQTDDGYPD